MKHPHLRIVATLLLSAAACAASAAEVLTDEQLDQVTAGTASMSYDRERRFLELHKTTALGTEIGVTGKVDSVAVSNAALQLSGSAQSDLHALINTNAVNSPVQVLMNLNININSSVNTLNQTNSGLQQR